MHGLSAMLQPMSYVTGQMTKRELQAKDSCEMAFLDIQGFSEHPSMCTLQDDPCMGESLLTQPGEREL